MSKSRSDPAIIHPRIAAQVQIGLMNRRMTIARHGERPYSITPQPRSPDMPMWRVPWVTCSIGNPTEAIKP